MNMGLEFECERDCAMGIPNEWPMRIPGTYDGRSSMHRLRSKRSACVLAFVCPSYTFCERVTFKMGRPQ